MKKIYLSMFVLALAGSVSAQKVGQNIKPLAKKNAVVSDVKAEKKSFTKDKVVIWQNDFSVSADWAMTNASVPAANWSISTDPTAVPVSALSPLGFTTASNGFAIIDSDALGAGATQDATIAYTGTIDCSAYPNVSLTFQQAHRRYQEVTTLQVSNDGGTTWTDFIINNGMTVNTNTTNPAMVQVNISAVAGGQSNVKIAFKYVGTYDWFWAVDDIQLMETPDFDLALNSVYWGSVGNWGARLPYSMVPSNQIQPVFFGGIVENAGAQAQADAIFGAQGGAFAGASVPTALAASVFDTLETVTQMTLPAVVGATTVNFGVTSTATDANAANNTLPGQVINVTAGTYARDMDNITGGSYNQGQGFEVGNIFDIFTTTTTNQVKFMPTATAVAGAAVYARIYGTGGSDFYFLAESDMYTLTAADLGTMITLDLQSTVDLLVDSSYLVVVGSFGDGGATNDLVVGTSGVSEAQTTYYFDMTDQTWYYTTATPMIRLMTGVNAINEVENVTSFGVYPNPASDKVAIEFELKNEANATIAITDLAGKTVYTQNVVNKAGKNTVSVNTSSFSNGVYVVNFTTANGVVTQKLVVNK